MCKCDKCGQEVSAENDATIVESFAFGEPMLILMSASRHFLPVYDNDGDLVCEGSPSRAQYIEGQARDNRGYVYHPEFEAQWRKGFAAAKEYARTK